jgi:large subunit ribosomal protein L37Ae
MALIYEFPMSHLSKLRPSDVRRLPGTSETFLNDSRFCIVMVKAQAGLGSIKRFGTRYGRPLKLKLAKVEVEQKKRHKCPYCSKPKVSQISFGIWHCEKCKAKFTARAGTKLSLAEQAAQMIAESPELQSNKTAEEEQ